MSASRGERALAWCWLGIRCARLLAALPFQLWRVWRGSRRLMIAYRSTVEPMIAARVTVHEREAEVRDRLAGWALQGGYLVDSYARVLGRCDAAELAVVAGSFTRLYDDVLDEGWDAGIGARLACLFDGDEVLAHSDIEWLAGTCSGGWPRVSLSLTGKCSTSACASSTDSSWSGRTRRRGLPARR
jgi:hypothetical protein